MIETAEVQDVVGRWWWNDDEGHFDVLEVVLDTRESVVFRDR